MATKRSFTSIRGYDSSEEEDIPTKTKATASKRSQSKPRAKASGHWSQGLVKSMDDPEKVVSSDDKCVMITDQYPKAMHHYLVLPHDDISGISRLGRQHLDLLRHMLRVGQDHVSKIKDSSLFKYGYHAVPSMSRLHMHVISCDFDSPCLKHKKHWNSFTTEYFINATQLIRMIEERGGVSIDKEYYEDLLKNPLICHVCGKEQRNMPQLKSHIKTHPL